MNINLTELTTIVSLILALSIASERLVEIIKGLIPFLNQENSNPTKEGWRRSMLHTLAVVAGIVTAVLAKQVIPNIGGKPPGDLTILALGFLASGGAGLWNSVLTYLLKIKDIKEIDAEQKKKDLEKGTGGGQ